jgi:hypothetical protein
VFHDRVEEHQAVVEHVRQTSASQPCQMPSRSARR